VVLITLSLAACSSGGGTRSGAGATVPGSTSTTDPYAVPATIDIPYLNRVFVALEKINGDATRLIVANRRITPEAAKLLASILTDEEFKIQADIWNDEINRGLSGFKEQPGDRRTTVIEILGVRGDCVSTRVKTDFTAIQKTPKPPSEGKVSLASRPPSEINKTPWAVSEDLKSGTLPCEQ
jgi:hypothetical protein